MLLEMASSITIALFAICLVLQPWAAVSNFLAPILAPIFEHVCKAVECGKGTCKESSSAPFFFECECDPGWQQFGHDDNENLKILPCVIPNCTLDYSCSAAPSPVQEKGREDHESFFDPCRWNYCGEGSCNKTSNFTHKCECNEGYYNLLNVTAFPCLRQCSLGLDCAKLGISVTNQSISSTPSSANSSTNSGKNQANSISQRGIFWLVALTVSLGIV